jgi:hypothetical protein
MHKILKTVLFFILIFISIFFGINFIIEKIISQNTKFDRVKNPSYLVLGHSHPHYAFNESLISGMLNMAEAGETYIYTYIKLKQILTYNKSIKFVLIDFSNNQISKKIENLIYGDTILTRNVRYYSSFMSLEEKFNLFKLNNKGFINAYFVGNRLNFLDVLYFKFDKTKDFGGYFPNPHKNLDSILKFGSIQTELKEVRKNENSISEINISYLEKCIQFCKSKNVKVILVRTPIYKNAPMLGNERVFQNYLHKKFGDIEFIDFKNYLLPISNYGDLTHLNYIGADKFSTWFDGLINVGLLESNNKQKLVDSAIATNEIQY